MKVVLDTNLFVASYWNKQSSSRKIFDLAQSGKLTVIWSRAIREEAEFILKRIKVSPKFFQLAKSIYKPENEVFPMEKINRVADYADNRLLEAAKTGEADYLITADRGVLEVKNFGETTILKPSEFLSQSYKT